MLVIFQPAVSDTGSHHCEFYGAPLSAGTILYKSQFLRPGARTMELPRLGIPSCAVAAWSALLLVLLGEFSRLYATFDSCHEPILLFPVRVVESIEGVTQSGSGQWWRIAGPR